MKRCLAETQVVKTGTGNNLDRTRCRQSADTWRYSHLIRDGQIAMLNLWPQATILCIEKAGLGRQLFEQGLMIIIYYQICLYLHETLSAWFLPGAF